MAPTATDDQQAATGNERPATGDQVKQQPQHTVAARAPDRTPQIQPMRLSQLLEEAVKSTELHRRPVGLTPVDRDKFGVPLTISNLSKKKAVPVVRKRKPRPQTQQRTQPAAGGSSVPPAASDLPMSPSRVPTSVLVASILSMPPRASSVMGIQPTRNARTGSIKDGAKNKDKATSSRNVTASTADVRVAAQAEGPAEVEAEIISEKRAGKMREVESEHATGRAALISVEELEELRADLIQSAKDNSDLRHEVYTLERKLAHMEKEKQTYLAAEKELNSEIEYWKTQAHAQAQATAAVMAAPVIRNDPAGHEAAAMQQYPFVGDLGVGMDVPLGDHDQHLHHGQAQGLGPAPGLGHAVGLGLGFGHNIDTGFTPGFEATLAAIEADFTVDFGTEATFNPSAALDTGLNLLADEEQAELDKERDMKLRVD